MGFHLESSGKRIAPLVGAFAAEGDTPAPEYVARVFAREGIDDMHDAMWAALETSTALGGELVNVVDESGEHQVGILAQHDHFGKYRL